MDINISMSSLKAHFIMLKTWMCFSEFIAWQCVEYWLQLFGVRLLILKNAC